MEYICIFMLGLNQERDGEGGIVVNSASHMIVDDS